MESLSLISNDIKSGLLEIYEYLKCNVLASNENNQVLRAKVESFYFSAIESYGDFYVETGTTIPALTMLPSIGEIADDIIDSEISSIEIILDEMGYKHEAIEYITEIYSEDIGANMEDYVGQILWEFGYPVKESGNGFKVIRVDQQFSLWKGADEVLWRTEALWKQANLW